MPTTPAKTSAAIPADVDTRSPAERAAEEKAAAEARDAQGANLVDAPEGDITANGAVLAPASDTVLGEDKGWGDVLIVAGAPSKMPTKGDRKVIVVESRTQPDENGAGGGQFDAEATYPKNADAYVGHFDYDAEGEPRAIFPDANGPVFLIGGNVRQFGFGGLSRQSGFLSVGRPPSAIYAAVNLAHQNGAKKVEIVGLTDYERDLFKASFDSIADEFKTLKY